MDFSYFVLGFVFTIIGSVFLGVVRTVARRQSFGTGVCSALCGGWGVTIGVLDFAKGFGHPLVDEPVRHVVVGIFTIFCVLSLVLIRKPKQS